MEGSVSMPSSCSPISNGVHQHAQFKSSRSLGGSSLHRKKVSWVPDTIDNEDVLKKSFKKESYVSPTSVDSSSNWTGAESKIGEDQSL